MWQQWYNSLSLITLQTASEISIYLPRILAALLVLLIGTVIAKTIKRIVIKVLETIKLSTNVEKTPVEHFLKNAEVGQKLESIIGSIIYWLLMLIVLQTTVAVLGLTSLSQVLDQVLGYIPNVISAILVLFLGVLLAGVVETVVKGAIRSIDGKSARLLGKVSSYLVVTIAALAAISELGIASEFIMILFVGFVTTVSLGFGLALGLGGKEIVAKMLNRWYDHTIEPGND